MSGAKYTKICTKCGKGIIFIKIEKNRFKEYPHFCEELKSNGTKSN